MYFDLVNANRRNVFQCLLRHSQLHGFPLPPASYCDFVAQLDRRNLKALA